MIILTCPVIHSAHKCFDITVPGVNGDESGFQIRAVLKLRGNGRLRRPLGIHIQRRIDAKSAMLQQTLLKTQIMHHNIPDIVPEIRSRVGTGPLLRRVKR
ncbi:hypothetical protein D3C76_1542460 [compost metagenome]